MKFPLFLILNFLCFIGAQAESCDAETGVLAFKVCQSCHTIKQKSSATLQGPSLRGLLGRKVGSLASFSYSPAMQAADFVWTSENLNDFIHNPTAAIPWNGMPFGGIEVAETRAEIVCYIAGFREE